MQFPLFEPSTTWRAPALSRLPSWRYAKRVAVDVETCDPELTKLGPGCRREGSFIAGVAFAIEDGPSFYLPTRHRGGGNLVEEKVFQYLRDQAKVFKGDLAGANLQYDLDWLAQYGVKYEPRFFKDVQVAEPLIDELQFKYSLDAIAGRHGIPGKAEDHLKKASELFGFTLKKMKENIWQLPAKHVGAYGEQDVRLPLQILRRQERIIDEQDLWKAFEMECRLLPVLLKMRRRGVRIDFDKIEQIKAWSLEKEREALKQLTALTGVQLDVSDTTKATALAPCLEKVGITVPKTPKNNLPSIKTEFLKNLNHEAGELIMTAKKFNKLRNTFVASIVRHAIGDRIHCTFNQLRRPRDDGSDDQGGRYGRMSCTDPNLQQQPARDPEIGPRWRGIYIPDEGGTWCCQDFSQQEPRWLTHYAAISGCTGAEAAREEYRNNPDMDNHQFMADLTGLPRKEAKNIFLGKCYGMGGAKFCRSLGLPTKTVPSRRLAKMIEVAGDEGQALLDTFDAKAPYVRELAWRAQNKAGRTGYIFLIDGRRCRFPERPTGGWDWTHKALNRLIQGSSAVQMKQAMVDADAAGFRLQLQVHDEVDLTIWNTSEALELEKVMLNAVECTVPHKVDIEIGPNWGEIKKLDKSKI